MSTTKNNIAKGLIVLSSLFFISANASDNTAPANDTEISTQDSHDELFERNKIKVIKDKFDNECLIMPFSVFWAITNPISSMTRGREWSKKMKNTLLHMPVNTEMEIDIDNFYDKEPTKHLRREMFVAISKDYFEDKDRFIGFAFEVLKRENDFERNNQDRHPRLYILYNQDTPEFFDNEERILLDFLGDDVKYDIREHNLVGRTTRLPY